MNQAERLAQLTAERDRYREEANKLRTVVHHMLEAGKHMNAAMTMHGLAEGEYRESIALMIGFDPDRVD